MRKKKNKWLRFLVFTLCLAAVDVVLFSQNLVGLAFVGAGVVTSCLAVGAVALNVVVGAFGYYNIFKKSEVPLISISNAKALEKPDDYFGALESCRSKQVFKTYIDRAEAQIYRFDEKSQSLTTLLSQYFTPEELTFKHFNSVLGSVQELFFSNLKNIINRMIIFDEEDFNKVSALLLEAMPDYDERQRIHSKVEVYNEHIEFIDKTLDNNDDVIVKLDELILELSKLDSTQNCENLEDLPAVVEINELIKNVKYYR